MRLRSYDWPGNVREMQNRIRRGVVMAEGDFIEPSDIDLQASGQEIKTLKQLRDEAEIKAISMALARNNYNITRAAHDLDISRPTLHDLLKKHDVQIQK